ncbi:MULTISPECIES: septation protein SepH [Actinomycetes]|uniref:Septation protein SepH n=2 Tax=Actinomycetes TaxID=1760 RepID=A0ABP6LNP5_9MICC
MQQLRIMGVTEDDSDELLVLADDQGQEFALPVDDALRAAVGRKSTRPPHLTTRAEDARAPMTVREVQARLRAGATVEQMVAESGLDPARVERYAGPVQAERAYVAELARSTAIAPPSSAEQHRIAFGDAPATLEAMALVRLRSLGVDLTSLAWDAWRRQDGSWQVVCWFSSDDEAAARARVDAGPPAEWVFSPESRHLRAVGPWAQTLSSLPPETGARRGPRRLTAVDAPFDVESVADSAAQRSDRGTGRPAATTPAPVPADQQDTSPLPSRSPDAPAGPTGEGDEHQDLLDVLRARRGRRLGADEDADDRLALMLTRDEQPSGQDTPRLRAVESAQTGQGEDDQQAPRDDERTESPDVDSPDGTDAWGFSYADSESPVDVDSSGPDHAAAQGAPDTAEGAGAPAKEPTPGEDPASAGSAQSDGDAATRQRDAGSTEDAAPAHAPKPKRSGSRRPSMPRWDDILFGSKGD